MALKQVASFQTSDGQLHASKLQALIREQRLEIRGVIQSGPGGIPLRNGHVATDEAVQIIIENMDKLSRIAGRYNKSIKHERLKAQTVAMGR